MAIKKLYLITIIICCFSAFTTAQEKVVHLVTGERSPYITNTYPEYGYAYDVVKEAFLRQGYNLEISFYPWTRANKLIEQGKAEGIMPIHLGSPLDEFIIASESFPGDYVGLLKHKKTVYQYPEELTYNQLIKSLAGQDIGLVRGSNLIPELENTNSINFVKLHSDLQSLDMLNAGRINFSLIDKYTAAHLMIENRPQYIGQLEFLQPEVAEMPFHIGFSIKSPNSKHLAEIFNFGLKQIKQDGTLLQIQAKYGLLPPVPNSDKIHLTIGSINNADMQIMQSLSSEFESEYPSIKLEWRVMDESTLRRRLLSDLALSDGKYDVMVIGNYEVPIWAKNKWVIPLTNLKEDYDVNDIFPSLRDSLSIEEQLYALPFYAESIMTYYRKDLFENAGIKMPESPTFGDIQSFARKIHDPDKGIYGICLRGKPGWGENIGIITSIVNAFGGRWFNEKWQPQLDSKEWKAAVRYYYNLVTQFGPPNTTSNGYNENLKLFLNGQCGIWIDATVAAGQLYNKQLSPVADEVGFAPAPTQQIASNWMWTWALAIPESSNQKEAALTFIQWATSKNYIRKVAETTGWTSVPSGTRQSTYSSAQYKESAPFGVFVEDAIKQAFSEGKATTDAVPYKGKQFVDIPEFVSFGSQVGQNMAEMLRDKLSINEALTKSQNEVLQQMKASDYIK